MTHNSEIPPTLSSEPSRRPRYLPPEPKKSGGLSKPPKSPRPSEPLNAQHPSEPPALPAFSNSLFSYEGRLGRLSLQAANLALILVMTLLIFVLTIIAVVVGIAGNISSIASNPFRIGFGLFGLIAIPIIIMLVYAIIFQVRRLHDLDRSGWWILLPIPFSIINMIATFTNIWGSSFISFACGLVGGLFYLYLLLMPGTAGNNRYGAPRHTPTSEKVMGWIYIVFLTLLLLMGYKISKTLPIGHSHPTDSSIITAKSPTSTTSSDPTSTTANAKYNAPYPFTAQQLWDNILKVTALPNGNLDATLIENAFGTKLQTETLPMLGQTYLTHAGTDWYFSLKFIPNMLGPNFNFFSFNWSDSSSSLGTSPPEKMCININDIKPSLLNQGWIAIPQDAGAQIASKVGYSKGGLTGLALEYYADSKCLKQLTLNSTKSGA